MENIRHGYELRYGTEYRSYLHDWRGASPRHHHKRFLISLVPNRDIRLLDIGCGPGYALCLLADMREKVRAFGIDFSLNSLLLAKHSAPVIQGDALHLPIKEGFIDVVTLVDVVEHLPDKGRLIDQCHRMLRDGGQLLISMPNSAALFFRNPADRSQPFDMPIDLKTLRRLIDGKFQITAVRGFRLLPGPIEHNLFIIERIARSIWFLRSRGKFLVIECKRI